MTPNEFKQKYPEFSHLEGDALWNKMEDVLLSGGRVLIADPDREIICLPPVNINGMEVYLEDESKIRWLDESGNEVDYVIGCDSYEGEGDNSVESHKMIIWDAVKNKEV